MNDKLKPCPSCGNEIAEDAWSCPKCGGVGPGQEETTSFIGWCLFGIGMFLLIDVSVHDGVSSIPIVNSILMQFPHR